MPETSYDVLIVGGGVVGSSVAYFSSVDSRPKELRICVVEPDPTYARSSTALSVGGIRQQFSTPENIALSLFSADFVRNAHRALAVGGEGPELGFREAGYLFLATSAGIPVLERNTARQREMGAEVELLTQEDLGRRFPWMNVSDLGGASLGIRNEGWLDPYSLLQAFKRKAQDQGVTYVQDRVMEIPSDGDGVLGATLEAKGMVRANLVVNAAGPRASEVARLAGVEDLPVQPRKRFVYRVESPAKLPGCPLVIDPSGVYVRPEGEGFLCGTSPPKDADPDTLDLDMEYELFNERVWPILAHRIPAFDSLRLGSSWAGHYAFNTLDQNAIVGPHPEIRNFLFANGFSGHGLQQSPGIGRAVAELILHGAYQTLDLTRFGFDRFQRGALLLEENVV
ncbi:MAG: FAD-binding oxidoreductase [Gemmatimonadota bacterium]|jgi:sarcosine oxidase